MFYREISGINLDEYISIINSPTDDKPFNKVYTVDYIGNVIEGNEILYLNLPIERLKKLVVVVVAVETVEKSEKWRIY